MKRTCFSLLLTLAVLCTPLAAQQRTNTTAPQVDRIGRGGGGVVVNKDGSITIAPAPGKPTLITGFDPSGAAQFPPVITSDQFGFVGDDSTDNTEAFVRLHTYLLAHDGATVIFTNSRGNTYRHHAIYYFDSVKHLRVLWNGARLRNNSSNSGFGCIPFSGYYRNAEGVRDSTFHGIERPNYLNTVAAGSRTVTLKNLATASNYAPGKWVFIGGYEQQGSSYPFNLRFYEINKVLSVDTAAGVVTLENPTKFAYREDWYPYRQNDLDSGGAIVVGPAQMISLNRQYFNLSEDIYFENLQCLASTTPNTVPSGLAAGADYSAQFIISGVKNFRAKGIKADGLTLGEIDQALIEDSDFRFGELDKLVDKMEFHRSRFGNLSYGTDFQQVVFDNCSFESTPDVYARNVAYRNTDFLGDAQVAPQTLFWPGQSLILENNRFYATAANDPTGLAFGMIQSHYDYPDQHFFTVATVAGSTVTADATVENGSLRMLLQQGAEIYTDTGKRGHVKEIAFDAATNRFVITADFTQAPAVGDVFRFKMLQLIKMAGNMWVNKPQATPQISGVPPAEVYRNADDAGGVIERVVPLLPAANTLVRQPLDGDVVEVTINITRAYTGTDATARLDIGSYIPGASSNLAAINLKQTGVRQLFSTTTSTPLSGDTLNPTTASFSAIMGVQAEGGSVTSDDQKPLGYVVFKIVRHR